jgi:hypothetical protein
MKEKEFNFVYLTTNLINGHQYVGECSTDDMNCYQTKRYLGSGTLLNEKIKEYDRKNFIRKDLEFFPTKQEAFNAQEKYIKLFKTHVSYSGYNKDWTGGWGCKKIVSEETKKKISKSKIGISINKGILKSDETKEKFKLAWEKRKIEKPMTKETKDKIAKYRKGKIHNQKTKDKIGCSNSLRIWKDESKQKIRDKRIGTILSEETKVKIGKKIPCIYCGKEMNAGNLSRYHNNNCKFK